jgi:hypothetical protein
VSQHITFNGQAYASASETPPIFVASIDPPRNFWAKTAGPSPTKYPVQMSTARREILVHS